MAFYCSEDPAGAAALITNFLFCVTGLFNSSEKKLEMICVSPFRLK